MASGRNEEAFSRFGQAQKSRQFVVSKNTCPLERPEAQVLCLDFAAMVDSIFIHVWQRPWTRIFALAVVLGLWITMVVAGCSSIVSMLAAVSTS